MHSCLAGNAKDESWLEDGKAYDDGEKEENDNNKSDNDQQGGVKRPSLPPLIRACFERPTIGDIVNDADVLCEKGNSVHLGNQRHGKLIAAAMKAYALAPSSIERYRLVKNVVDTVNNEGGRLLRRTRPFRWHEISYCETVSNIAKGLRLAITDGSTEQGEAGVEQENEHEICYFDVVDLRRAVQKTNHEKAGREQKAITDDDDIVDIENTRLDEIHVEDSQENSQKTTKSTIPPGPLPPYHHQSSARDNEHSNAATHQIPPGPLPPYQHQNYARGNEHTNAAMRHNTAPQNGNIHNSIARVERARVAYEHDYARALARSRELYDLQKRLSERLNEIIREHDGQRIKIRNDYMHYVYHARLQWEQSRRNVEQARLDKILPSRQGQARTGTDYLRRFVMQRGDEVSVQIADCIADIIGSVETIAEGSIQNEKIVEEFKRPSVPDHMKSVLNHQQYVQKQIRDELSSLTIQLHRSEHARRHAFDKMMAEVSIEKGAARPIMPPIHGSGFEHSRAFAHTHGNSRVGYSAAPVHRPQVRTNGNMTYTHNASRNIGSFPTR